MKTLTTISQKLKTARERKNYSRRELRERLKMLGVDVTEQTIINWENGVTMPKADRLFILSKALGVQIGFFCS